MKKLIIMLVILAAGGFLMSGCETLVYTPQEHTTMQQNAWKIQGLQLTDDWDYLWLCERSSSLSEWHAHVGN